MDNRPQGRVDCIPELYRCLQEAASGHEMLVGRKGCSIGDLHRGIRKRSVTRTRCTRRDPIEAGGEGICNNHISCILSLTCSPFKRHAGHVPGVTRHNGAPRQQSNNVDRCLLGGSPVLFRALFCSAVIVFDNKSSCAAFTKGELTCGKTKAGWYLYDPELMDASRQLSVVQPLFPRSIRPYPPGCCSARSRVVNKFRQPTRFKNVSADINMRARARPLFFLGTMRCESPAAVREGTWEAKTSMQAPTVIRNCGRGRGSKVIGHSMNLLSDERLEILAISTTSYFTASIIQHPPGGSQQRAHLNTV